MTPSLSALCISLLLLGSLVTGCNGPVKNQATFTVRSVKMLEPRAIQEAEKWKTDAYLSSVSVNALALDSRPPLAYADTLSFGFESPSDPGHSYEVAFLLNDKIELREWSIPNPHTDFVPIKPSDWTIDSTDAWRIAQENGGEQFLREHQADSPDTFLILERRNPPRSGPLLWYVGYSKSGTSQVLRIFLDARTGVVVREETE